MPDPRHILCDVLEGELHACPVGRERILSYPSIDGLWLGGAPYSGKVRRTADDVTWWFVEAFEDPAVAAAVKRILDSVPDFFFKLASLSKGPVHMDWNLVNKLRDHLRVAAFPPAYEIATNSTKNDASERAARLLRRLTTAEEWQTTFSR